MPILKTWQRFLFVCAVMFMVHFLEAADKPTGGKMSSTKIVLVKEFDSALYAVCWLAVNGDGTKLLSCNHARNVQLLEATGLKPIKSLGNLGSRAAFVLDDKCAAVADEAKTAIKIVDLKSAKVTDTIEQSGLFSCHSKLNLLAYPEPVGLVTIFDLSKKKVLKQYNTGSAFNCQTVEGFSKKGILVVDPFDGKRCLVWHPPYDKDPVTIPCGHFFRCAAISPDERHLALAVNRENRAEVWDLKSNKKIVTLGKHKGDGDVRGLVYSPDGRFLASLGGAAGEVILWDTKEYREVARVTAHELHIHSLVFYPDSKQFATSGNSDTYIRLWKIEEDKTASKSK